MKTEKYLIAKLWSYAIHLDVSLTYYPLSMWYTYFKTFLMDSMVRKASVLLKQSFISGPWKIMAVLPLMCNQSGYKTEVCN